MKRALVAATGLATVVAGIGTLAGTSAAGASDKQVFTVTGHQTSFHVVDNGAKGASAGDYGVISGKLTRQGKPAGRYQGFCVQFDAKGHSHCTFTFALHGGQIDIEAAYGRGFNGNKTVHEAIVGGTGAYSEARGYTTGQETGPTTIKEVLHIQ